MKLKIKLKNLIAFIVLFLAIVLIVVPLVNIEIAIYLNNKGSAKADVFYKNYMSSPIKLNKKRCLYDYARSITGEFEKVQINFNSWGGGSNTRPEDMEKAIEIFEEILLKDEKTDYKDEYSTKSYLKLLDTSIATLDSDKLLYWISWGKDKSNEEIKYNSRLYEAYYQFVEKNYKLSKELLDALDGEELDAKYYQLMGDIHLHLGDIEKAEGCFETIGTDFSDNINSYQRYFGGNNRYLDHKGFESYIEKSKGAYKVNGKVSHNGKGLPFVEVYLSQNIGSLYIGPKIPDAVTDENGEFETLSLKQGVYEMGIDINSSQLYNKVFLKKDIRFIELKEDMVFNFDFKTPLEILTPIDNITIKDEEDFHISWSEEAEADYYRVESLVFTEPKTRSGGSYKVALKDLNGEEKIKTNSLDFNINKLDKTIQALSYEGEEEIVNTTGIFGSFIPNVEYPIIVNAYDKDDKLVASSLTQIIDYEDLVSLSIEGELTKGEKLILDKKYEEAIAHYEKKIKENPEDKEALFYLVRFYSIGWKIGEKDISKAIRYAEVYDKNYKDYNLSFEVIESMRQSEIEENKRLVKKVLEGVAEEDKNWRYYNRKAMYHLAEGDLIKARENYDKEDKDKSVIIVYIDMYLEDYKKAIETLNSGELLLLKMDRMKVIEALNDLEDVGEEDKDSFKKLLKMAIDNNISIDEQESIYKKTINSIKSLELKKIIKEIGREEYLDYEH